MNQYQIHEVVGDGWMIKRTGNDVTIDVAGGELLRCDLSEAAQWQLRLANQQGDHLLRYRQIAAGLGEVIALCNGEYAPRRVKSVEPDLIHGGCFGLVLAVLVSLPVAAWFGVVIFCWMDW